MEKYVLLPHHKYNKLSEGSGHSTKYNSISKPLPVPPGIPQHSPNLLPNSDRQKSITKEEEEEEEEDNSNKRTEDNSNKRTWRQMWQEI